MKLAIGADHAGVGYKDVFANELRAAGHDVVDVGTEGRDSVDYPDFAQAVAERLARGEVERGILICGSAVGVCIAANKVKGIRAVTAWTKKTAKLSRQHNDANILCLSGWLLTKDKSLGLIETFLTTDFSGEARHQRRINKISRYEK